MTASFVSRAVICSNPKVQFDRQHAQIFTLALRPNPPLICNLHHANGISTLHLGWKRPLYSSATPVRLPPPAAQPGQGQQPAPPSFPLVPTSVAFYGAMTAAAVVLGRSYDIGGQLLSPLRLTDSLPYLGVMLGLLVVSTALAEVVPSFKELKQLYQTTLIPSLKAVPLWGLAAMAAGAGIGEEALFRGLMQTWIAAKAAGVRGRPPNLPLLQQFL